MPRACQGRRRRAFGGSCLLKERVGHDLCAAPAIPEHIGLLALGRSAHGGAALYPLNAVARMTAVATKALLGQPDPVTHLEQRFHRALSAHRGRPLSSKG